jgi:hypothetical protein
LHLSKKKGKCGIDLHYQQQLEREKVNLMGTNLVEQQKQEKEEAYSSYQKFIRHITVQSVIAAIIFVIILVIFFNTIVLVGKVPNPVTGTNITQGDVYLSNNLAYKKNLPNRGDAVIIKTDGKKYAGIILGLPKEKVSIKKGGKVEANGDDTFIKVKGLKKKTVNVKKDEYLIALSDDRTYSLSINADIARLYFTMGRSGFHFY